jgi:hypothetical protein
VKKRWFDSARVANVISASSLIVAILACYCAYRAQGYNAEVYAGERREEVIALLRQDIAGLEEGEAFLDEVLNHANYKLPNDQIIQLSEARKRFQEAIPNAKRMLDGLDRDSTKDPTYWLKKRRWLADMHAQFSELQNMMAQTRHNLGLDVQKE